MSRAYIRLDPAFDEHKYEYPDGAYAALVGTFCLAELQPQRGRFRSVDYLKRLLGKRGKWVNYLLEHEDLVQLEDGRAYVEGWDEWQEGDWKVTERVHRIRGRRNGDVTVDVTPDVTVPVTPDRLISGAERSGAVTKRSGAKQRADLEAFYAVTNRAPTAKQLKVLDDYQDTFDVTGEERATKVILANPGDPIGALLRDLNQFRASRRSAA